MSDAIVPFGKYRGQPVEVLAGDRQYTDWLAAQPWFRERYGALYSIVINHFAPPSDDTPEHNALQAKFLEKEYCLRFFEVRRPNWLRRSIDKEITWGHDNERHDYVERLSAILNGAEMRCSMRTSFEERGVDVFIECSYRPEDDKLYMCNQYVLLFSQSARIEIKPTVGDDYPTVLRQVKQSKCDTLFLGQYSGAGITESQFIRLFNNERIDVIFDRDV